MTGLIVFVELAGALGAALSAVAASHYLDHDHPVMGILLTGLFVVALFAVGVALNVAIAGMTGVTPYEVPR